VITYNICKLFSGIVHEYKCLLDIPTHIWNTNAILKSTYQLVVTKSANCFDLLVLFWEFMEIYCTHNISYFGSTFELVGCHQGRIKPPKVPRGHATFIDGKMLSVTKYRIQILLV